MTYFKKLKTTFISQHCRTTGSPNNHLTKQFLAKPSEKLRGHRRNKNFSENPSFLTLSVFRHGHHQPGAQLPPRNLHPAENLRNPQFRVFKIRRPRFQNGSLQKFQPSPIRSFFGSWQALVRPYASCTVPIEPEWPWEALMLKDTCSARGQSQS